MKQLLALCFTLLLLCPLLLQETTSISEENMPARLLAKLQVAPNAPCPSASSIKNVSHWHSDSSGCGENFGVCCDFIWMLQNGRVFYPIGYGADPTGANESSDPILQALNDAFNVQSGLELLPGVKDLGGVIIDFQGGNYKISKPIRFPPGVGNVVVSSPHPPSFIG